MKQFKELHRVKFEYNEKHYTQDEIAGMIYSCKRFSDCYKNPSKTKQDINEEWYGFYNTFTDSYYYGILSHNTSFFTIFFMLEDYTLDGIKSDFIVRITPTHKYLTRII